MAADTELFMQIEPVRNIAKTLKTVSDVLKGVDKGLKALSHVLQTAACMGLVAAAALKQYVDQFEKQIRELYEKFAELSSDVSNAVNAYEAGDFEAAENFGS